ncbi:MAG: DNA-binding response regulator [Candidatus Firestonebacteria bacterium RIFOXYD2_FULL_39_29]|nr:MAG: DNA-binding response regulator [Candidatus Firestonebacteria bacterium RIFOXYD2_FULL_39_29]
MRILVIEDEKKIANIIKKVLKKSKYAVDVATTASEAIYLSDVNTYDLLIMDIMLPDKDGFTLCREIRQKKMDVPILMLTARNNAKDKITGLDSGADDYLTKPFSIGELLARIRALLRRKSRQKTNVLSIGTLELDQLSHKVKCSGEEVVLSNKEYMILEFLMLNVNQVITRSMISEHVWSEEFDSFSNVIDVHVNYLRNKIDKGRKVKLIHTIRGVGYVLKGKINEI